MKKKLFLCLIVAVLTLGLAVTAFAESETTTTESTTTLEDGTIITTTVTITVTKPDTHTDETAEDPAKESPVLAEDTEEPAEATEEPTEDAEEPVESTEEPAEPAAEPETSLEEPAVLTESEQTEGEAPADEETVEAEAPTESEKPVAEDGEAELPQWIINDQDISSVLPEDAQKAFDAATENLFGATFEPIAYLGSQVVAGTNYAILCRATPDAPEYDTTLVVMILYVDLSGQASISEIITFPYDQLNLTAETAAAEEPAAEDIETAEEPTAEETETAEEPAAEEAEVSEEPAEAEATAVVEAEAAEDPTESEEPEAEETEGAEEPAAEESETADEPADKETETAEDPAEPEDAESVSLLGGWQIPAENVAVTLPEDVQAAFDAATEGFVGNDLTPIVFLASLDSDNGTDYAILCRSQLVTQEPVVSLQTVIIHADTDGNAAIVSICTVDVGEIVSKAEAERAASEENVEPTEAVEDAEEATVSEEPAADAAPAEAGEADTPDADVTTAQEDASQAEDLPEVSDTEEPPTDLITTT